MIEATLELENEIKKEANWLVIGIDEAGRGPLAGPVVAAAVSLEGKVIDNECWRLIRDSKKLSANQRTKVCDFLLANFNIGVGFCDNKTVDRVNILEASFLAMKKAVQDLQRKVTTENKGIYALVDGNKEIPNFSIKQKTVVGGDKFTKSIAAASIIAKVKRDTMMLEFHKIYPQYGFDKHKGYGTKVHLEMLEKFGPCDIHRKSFGPVSRLANSKKR